MNYESTVKTGSRLHSGVAFTTRRMSFGRRLELAERARGIGRALEFEQAGQGLADRVSVAVTTGRVDRMLLEWGLVEVTGLEIDGKPASPASCIEQGPESLVREILDVIQAECGLSEEERKN